MEIYKRSVSFSHSRLPLPTQSLDTTLAGLHWGAPPPALLRLRCRSESVGLARQRAGSSRGGVRLATGLEKCFCKARGRAGRATRMKAELAAERVQISPAMRAGRPCKQEGEEGFGGVGGTVGEKAAAVTHGKERAGDAKFDAT